MQRVILALCAAWSAFTFAQSPLPADELRLARYTTAAALPSATETDPLQSVITIHFPRQQVSTVAQALDYLLIRTGYRLGKVDQPEVQQVFALALPEVHRRLGPCSVETALRVLLGDAFSLSVDRLRRQITYGVSAHQPAVAIAAPSALAPATGTAATLQSDVAKSNRAATLMVDPAPLELGSVRIFPINLK